MMFLARRFLVRLKHPEYKELLRQNRQFRDTYKGKRCFILGNGPSLNKLDFSSLSKEYVFTVNQITRNEGFRELQSNFHLWSDGMFFEIDENSSEDRELLEVMREVSRCNKETISFYAVEARKMIQKYHLDQCLNIHYFAQIYSSSIEEGTGNKLRGFVDFTKISCGFYTVIHTAVCLAVYMGFSEIYLLGCDCNGFLNIAASRGEHTEEEAAYGYDISENEKKRLKKVAQRKTVEEELQGYAWIYHDYALLRDYCTRQGVRLLNATDGSLLDCLPRVTLDDVLKQTPSGGESSSMHL